MSDAILQVTDLVKRFPIKGGFFGRTVAVVDAVSGVSFSVGRGETLGLVGESGCGKSTVARAVLRLHEPDSGSIVFDGRDVRAQGKHDMRRLRREMQIVFQDPYASLNPRWQINNIVGEPLAVQGISGTERKDKVQELLGLVGLNPEHGNRYPHEFSGGQRQRIGIARALALDPKLIMLDEPVSALDVSVQAGVINLLEDLQDRLGLSYVFVAHDLSVVRHISDRVAVMYLGKIVEIAGSEEVIKNPLHPYTRALISAVPVPDPAIARPVPNVRGGVSKPINPHPRCRFYERCPVAQKVCRESDHPGLREVEGNHFAACHLL